MIQASLLYVSHSPGLLSVPLDPSWGTGHTVSLDPPSQPPCSEESISHGRSQFHLFQWHEAVAGATLVVPTSLSSVQLCRLPFFPWTSCGNSVGLFLETLCEGLVFTVEAEPVGPRARTQERSVCYSRDSGSLGNGRDLCN